MKIEIRYLNEAAKVPMCGTLGSAGVDLVSTSTIRFSPGGVDVIHTGVAIHIASGGDSQYAGLILPRSGLGGTRGLILANSIGLIDSDYQGELIIQGWNRNTSEHIQITQGERVAQLIIVPVVKIQWEQVVEFSNKSERFDGGFGSTGKYICGNI